MPAHGRDSAKDIVVLTGCAYAAAAGPMHLDAIGGKVRMVHPSSSWRDNIALQLRMAHAGMLPGCSGLGAADGIASSRRCCGMGRKL